MAVAQNNEIKKQELIDNFSNNLLNAMFSGQYHLTNLPRFSGTAGSWTNPQAIPSSQLSTNTKPGITIADTVCTASTVYSQCKTVVDSLTRIRYFTSNWYWQTNSNHGLVNSVSGSAIFLATIPMVPAYPGTGNGRSGWTRTITGAGSGAASTSSATITSTLTVTNPLNQNKEIKASEITPYTLNAALFNYLYNAWNANRNNRITYNFFTCHSNCYFACQSRSRR